MTKTKIRRSLFIGLGGTGMRTLLDLKKLFIDTYGEVPPMIGFLGVDTDMNEFSKELKPSASDNVGVMQEGSVATSLHVEGTQRKQENIKFDPTERIVITVDNPQDVYKVKRKNFDWIPPQNLRALISLTNGAGRVRTNGRFAFVVNSNIISSKIYTALNKIGSISTVNSTIYELIDKTTQIYLIFSLGGGTGCGTFLDMAYLVRQVAPECKLAGYGILPEVFRTKFAYNMERVRPNGYGAVTDLDYLMNLNWDSKEIVLPLANGQNWSTNQTPFDACILVDNQNSNNDVYDDNAQLEEMIALSLVTAVGELSRANTSVLDNLAVSAAEGAYDLEHKKAWASGMGICEVTVMADELRKLYAHQATVAIVNKLLNKPEKSLDTDVDAWINSPEVKIREHDADDVIDYLLKPDIPNMPALDRDDYDDAETTALNYVIAQQEKKENIEARLKVLIARVSEELRKFIIRTINSKQGNGVGAAEEILQGITSRVTVYRQEMTDELEECKQHTEQLKAVLSSRAKELKAEKSSFIRIFKSSDLRDMADEIKSTATQIAVDERNSIRHDYAITFFTELLSRINTMGDTIFNIRKRLEDISRNSKDEIEKIKSNIWRQKATFQYDLTDGMIGQAEYHPGEASISDLVDNLDRNKVYNKVYDFADMETPTVWRYILQFCYNLNQAKKIGDMDINDIMNAMSQEAFDELVRKIVAKASPLLPYNYHGYKTGNQPVNYYIGVSDFKTSRLKKDDYFKNNISDAGNVDFSQIGMRDRLIVFSQMTPIPSFAISSMKRCCDEYNNPYQTIDFHFDYFLEQKMKQQGYSIWPGKQNNNTMELWVKGLIFGLVKKADGKYKYIDDENGDPLADYWMDLTQYRDQAFRAFKDIKGNIEDQFNKRIADITSTKGVPYYKDIIKDAKANYWDKYSGIGLSKGELRSDPLKKDIAQQMCDELEYVKKLEI